MTALTELTMAAARDGLARKEFSARELAAAHVAAVEAIRPGCSRACRWRSRISSAPRAS
jgi:Asp-tRNA(Asn)/Glu-tRNA(Gln) amidotransferase A subunit family amidase